MSGNGDFSASTPSDPFALALDGLRLARSGKTRTQTPLEEALERAILAEREIPAEQAKFDERIKNCDDEIWRNFLCYQRDLVEWQLTRAATIAKRRIKYKRQIRTHNQWHAERTKCKDDKLHWFQQWAWTMDPRTDSPLTVVPFEPFPYQEAGLRWLDETVFQYRQGGAQVKSRDMGATWLNVGWSSHCWLYIPHFQVFFSSRNEDEVDSRKEPDTIFEKLRFTIRMLPDELKPDGYDEKSDATFALLANPENGATISGGAPTPNVGRGGRYGAAFFDEFAAFPHEGNPQFLSISQSTRSLIVTSTPQGLQNRFAKLVHTQGYRVFKFMWSDHPWKDDRWREGEPSARNMLPHEVAQEIDMDFRASETGQRFREYDETLHVVTWSEIVAVFGDAAKLFGTDGRWTPRLPASFGIGVGQDWGETIGHPTATVWVGRPPGKHPLADCMFVYREMIRPQWPVPPPDWKPPTALRMATDIYSAELEWNEAPRVQKRLMSPDALEARRSYTGDPDAKHVLPSHLRMLNWSPWVARNDYGFAQLQTLLEVDEKRPHPFRTFPAGHKNQHQPLEGRPRIYFVVPDDQGRLGVTADGVLTVAPAVDESGLARIRAEIPAKRKETDLSGNERKTDRKIFDDAIDALRGLLSHWGPRSIGPSENERVYDELKRKGQLLTAETLATMDEAARGAALVTFQSRLDEVRKDVTTGTKPRYWRTKEQDHGSDPQF